MIQVRCPICNNRLFDAENNYLGEIKIKCSKCRKLIKVNKSNTLKKIEFSFIMS